MSTTYKQTRESLDNLNGFLLSEDIDWNQVKWDKSGNADSEIALEIKNGDFYYTDEKKANLIKEVKAKKDLESKIESWPRVRRALRALKIMAKKSEPTEEELKKEQEKIVE